MDDKTLTLDDTPMELDTTLPDIDLNTPMEIDLTLPALDLEPPRIDLDGEGDDDEP